MTSKCRITFLTLYQIAYALDSCLLYLLLGILSFFLTWFWIKIYMYVYQPLKLMRCLGRRMFLSHGNNNMARKRWIIQVCLHKDQRYKAILYWSVYHCDVGSKTRLHLDFIQWASHSFTPSAPQFYLPIPLLSSKWPSPPHPFSAVLFSSVVKPDVCMVTRLHFDCP